MVEATKRRRRAEPKKAQNKFVQMEELDESINLLVYGDSGIGKTVFAGSAPKVGILSVEKGTISAKIQGSDAMVWPMHKWSDLEEGYDYLFENPDHGFDWIVIDSLTKMQRLALRGILDHAVDENGSRDLDIPAIQDHFKWQNMLMRFVTAFCDLPVNVLFLAGSMQADDEEGEPFLTPAIQGKGYQMSQLVAAEMTSYGYMKKVRVAKRDAKGNIVLDKNGKKVPHLVRRTYWEDNGRIRAKSRFPALVPYTDDLTLAELTDLMKKPLAVQTPKTPAATSASSAARRTSRRSTT